MKNEATATANTPTSFEAKKRQISITVVGVGSEFRGDDTAGVLTVRKLKEKVPAGVRTTELVGDQSDLLELMRSTDAIIIVDAVRSSVAAGTVFRVDASEQSMPENFFSISTHALDAAQAVELARTLDILPKRVIFYGIVGKEFSYTPTLSREVEKAISVVQSSVLKDITARLTGEDSDPPRKAIAATALS